MVIKRKKANFHIYNIKCAKINVILFSHETEDESILNTQVLSVI